MSEVLVQFGIPKRSTRKVGEAKRRKHVTRNKIYPTRRSDSQLRSWLVIALCLAFESLAGVAAWDCAWVCAHQQYPACRTYGNCAHLASQLYEVE